MFSPHPPVQLISLSFVTFRKYLDYTGKVRFGKHVLNYSIADLHLKFSVILKIGIMTSKTYSTLDPLPSGNENTLMHISSSIALLVLSIDRYMRSFVPSCNFLLCSLNLYSCRAQSLSKQQRTRFWSSKIDALKNGDQRGIPLVMWVNSHVF